MPRAARSNRQRALTKDPLQLLLATYDESLKRNRERALLLFDWATGGAGAARRPGDAREPAARRRRSMALALLTLPRQDILDQES
jgi:hypothetical protein